MLGACGAQGDIFDRVEGADIALFVLDADKIMVAVAVIDPETWGEVDARIQRCHDGFDDLVLAKAVVRGFEAIHVDLEQRIIVALLDVSVHDPGDAGDARSDLVCKRGAFLQIGTCDLEVDRRRQSEVERRGQQSARIKGEFKFRQSVAGVVCVGR